MHDVLTTGDRAGWAAAVARRAGAWPAILLLTVLFVAATLAPASAQGRDEALRLAIAEAAGADADIFAFYRESGFEPVWVGRDRDQRARRKALVEALRAAPLHALPAERYDLDGLLVRLRKARRPDDLGRLEVDLTRTYLRYARDVQTGILVPSKVDPEIARKPPYRARRSYLEALVKYSPRALFASLPPASREYLHLMDEKLRLERLLARGGWGEPVPAGKLEAGDSGPAVVALRDRLIRMGYLKRTLTTTYDDRITEAVVRFQRDHGLAADGVAGKATIAAINKPVEERLKSVIVAMERERWTNFAEGRGKRHVVVNIPAFEAVLYDDGKATYRSDVVVGKNAWDRKTPEFSDFLEFIVVNPSWYVPRSIVTREFLPQLKKDPLAVHYIEITDDKGRVIDPRRIDFSKYTEEDFPFAMRQPPSRRNALGVVKFMFPNRHNVYMHDTPEKHLFGRAKRDFSHGCIRLAKPFEFAYTLLGPQVRDPKSYFHRLLETGEELQVDLKKKVPVHIMYRTAFSDEKGVIRYRHDVYGRDAKIFAALQAAGVSLRALRG